MKAVFDSNIFVSAFALPGGQAEKALTAAVEGRVDLAISRPIILEVLDVLARKFDRNADELARVAVFLSELARLVQSRVRIRVLRDEPDNRILECALASKSDVIVTGDRAMLALGSFEGIRILSLREFLEALR